MGNNNERNDQAEIRRKLRAEGVVLVADRVIGKGSFSSVCCGYSTRLEKHVAIKLIDTRVSSEYIQRFLPRELQLIPTLDHPNIVKFHGIVHSSAYTAMVQEYQENGDLLKLLKNRGKIDEEESRFMFRQLIEAIRYMERRHIVHRDIKCENIFLDRYFNVKLGDFGFARILGPAEVSDTHCGSRAYVALELLQGLDYTGNAADIWSAGVVLFIMLTGKMPFDDRKPTKMMNSLIRHDIRFPDGSVSADAQELIRSMVHPRIELRATSQEILDSHWLSNTRYIVRGQVSECDSCSTASNTSEQSGSNADESHSSSTTTVD